MINARAEGQHPEIAIMVSGTVISVVRILIGSYFLAAATGLVFDPANRTFLDAVLPLEPARLITTTYLYVTAFAIMVGYMVRPAALLLAVYMFWSGFVHYDLADPVALSEFWRDMALLGAVLMIAVTERGAGTQVRVWRKPDGADSGPQQEAIFAGVTGANGEIDIYECAREERRTARSMTRG